MEFQDISVRLADLVTLEWHDEFSLVKGRATWKSLG